MIQQQAVVPRYTWTNTKPTYLRCKNERPGLDSSPLSIVVEVPPTRKSTLEPKAVPVVHSPAYFLQSDQEALLADVMQTQEVSKPSTKDMNFEENPVDYVLASADEVLNEMEKNPTEATKAIWEMSNSPIGKGTAAGVRTAAKVTLKAGTEAVKMAIPVGTWALKEGFKTVSKLMKDSSLTENQD